MKPINQKKLDALFEGFFKAAKENLQRDGYLIPCVFLLSGTFDQPQVANVIEMQFETETDKDSLARNIEALIKSTGAWGYVMVHEAWTLDKDDFPNEELPKVPPSSHPKKREAIFVSLFTYDNHRGTAVLFERRHDKIRFTKEIVIEPHMTVGGRFAKMLPPMN